MLNLSKFLGRIVLDSVLGSGFALLRQHPDEQQAFASLHSPIWQRLGMRFVAIQPDESAGNVPWHDPSLFVLVRPDRYMYGAFKEEEEAAFVADLQKLLTFSEAFYSVFDDELFCLYNKESLQ